MLPVMLAPVTVIGAIRAFTPVESESRVRKAPVPGFNKPPFSVTVPLTFAMERILNDVVSGDDTVRFLTLLPNASKETFQFCTAVESNVKSPPLISRVPVSEFGLIVASPVNAMLFPVPIFSVDPLFKIKPPPKADPKV